MTRSILAISGSLRERSYNSALLRAAAEQAGDAAVFDFADIGALPHYRAELDRDDKPATVMRFLDQIRAADGLLIATPEYNYSIPGVLKNAIDWASRPAYKSPLAHKKTGIMGASPSAVGSARAQSHLRQILGGTLTPLFLHPDFLCNSASKKFDADGSLTDAPTRERLASYMGGFLDWIDHRV
jgi:chromate reductase